MAHTYFAQIDGDNIVTTVHVVTTEYMAENPDRYTGIWVETFIDLPTKTYAGIGYTYDAALDEFVAPPSPEPVPSA